MPTDVSYRSRAVRAMVILHEEHLRRFVRTWRSALATSVSLPSTLDPNYGSMETLGRHVLNAAGGYLVWICEVLNLPNPEVGKIPDPKSVAQDGDDYLEHILDRWRNGPLREVTDEQLDGPEYRSRWQALYTIDAMLEHAVMHPIRHTFQLEELMKSHG